MSEEYDNFLRCKSNPYFLNKIAPHEILKNTRAKFISFKNNEYYFQSRNYSLSDAAHQLAKKFPDEEFELDFWNADPIVSEKTTISFIGDCSEIIGVEPIFHFSYAPYLKKIVGDEVFSDFLEKVNSYFEAIKPFIPISESRKWDEGISIQYDDFKLEAVLTFRTLISIRGFSKSVSGLWEMIDKPCQTRKIEPIKNDNDAYDDE